MKTILRIFVALLIASPISAMAADAFEGRINLSLSSGKGRPQELQYAVKGSRVRMEIETDGQAFASILDLSKHEILILMPEESMYMVMPMSKTEEIARGAAETAGKIEKTGRTETILGHKCDEYVAREKSTTTEIWLAEELGTFMGITAGGGPMMGGGRGKGSGSWEDAFKGKPGIPLRVISRDSKERETFRMEATKIEPGTLPDSLFAPPADFQKFEMPSLGGFNPFKQG